MTMKNRTMNIINIITVIFMAQRGKFLLVRGLWNPMKATQLRGPSSKTLAMVQPLVPRPKCLRPRKLRLTHGQK